MALTITIQAAMNFGNKSAKLFKVKGDGSLTEVETNMYLDAVICAGNVDDTAAIVDAIIDTTDKSKFNTAVQATPTAIASGKYRYFLCIGSA